MLISLPLCIALLLLHSSNQLIESGTLVSNDTSAGEGTVSMIGADIGVTDNISNINYDDNLSVCTDAEINTMIGADLRLDLTDTELIGADNDTGITSNRSTTIGAVNRSYRTIYIGHSGTTLHNRMLEQKKAGSAIYKHHQELHRGNPPVYRSKIIDIQPKNQQRLVSEALNINRSNGQFLINRKGEFGKMHLPRLVIKENINELSDKGHTSGIQPGPLQ